MRSFAVSALLVLAGCAANTTVTAPVQTEGTGPVATERVIPAGQDAGCVIERHTVETAMDVYLALNGSDVTSLDALVPDLLKEPVSARWSLQPDPAGGPPVLTGIDICAGA